MKRKITTILLAMFLVAGLAVGLSACNKKCKHKYGEWKETVTATCTEEGEKTRVCSKCGKQEKEAIEALDHEYLWESDEKEHWESCTHTGCTETKNKGVHVFASGETVKCNGCGASLERVLQTIVGDGTKDGVDITLNLATNAGSDVFTGIKNGIALAKNGSVNLTVTGAETIPSRAFEACNQLGKVTFGEGVKKIGDHAFVNNGYMTSAIMETDVTEISERAFFACNKLAEIKLGNKVTTIGVGAFNTTAIESVTLPDGVTEIGANVFGYCSNLKTVVLSNKIEKIPANAFYGTVSLKDITLPSGLKTIDDYAFQATRIETLVIPDSVTSVGKEAFSSNTALKSVTFGKGITKLNGNLFFYCSSLTEITFLSPITEVDKYTFYDATVGFPAYNLATENVTLYLAYGQKVLTLADGETSYTATADGLTDGTVFCGTTFKAVYVVAGIDASTMSADELQNAISELITAGTTNISVKLAPSADSGMFTAITNGISGAQDGSVSLTVSGASVIPENAFLNNTKICNVTLGEGVVTVGAQAFEQSSLKKLTFGKNVKNFNKDAFYKASSLNDIYYKGELEDWVKINFENNASNPSSCSVKLYFNGELLENLTVTSNLGVVNPSAFSGCLSLKSVTIADGVTSVVKGLFYRCENLESVTIGKDVTSIGDYAFSGCYGLTDLTIPDGVISIGQYAFYYCDALERITIGKNVESIGDYAFSACYGLTDLTIPDGVISIGQYAFYYCYTLESITIGKNVESIGKGAFYYCYSVTEVVIPDKVTTIGDGVFCDCSSLASITLPASLTSIGTGVFSYCESLKTVYFTGELEDWLKITFGDGGNPCGYNAKLYFKNVLVEEVVIPSSAKTVAENLFSGCSSITKVVISDGITAIGDSAFNDCQAIKTLTIGKDVESIGYCSFWGCSSLTSVVIPSSVKVIGSNSFNRCSSLASITFSEGNLEEIKGYAFSYTAIKSVNLPNGVKKLGSGAFHGTALTSFVVPDSVTEIGGYFFLESSKLESVVIGSGITDLSGVYGLFNGCDALKNITFKAPLTKLSKTSIAVNENWLNTTGITIMLSSGQKNLVLDGETYVAGTEDFVATDTVFCGRTFAKIVFSGVIDVSEMSTEQITEAVTTAVRKGVIDLTVNFASDDGEDEISAVVGAIHEVYSDGNFNLTITGVTKMTATLYNYDWLQSITFGDGITTLGEQYAVINHCSSLESATIGKSVKTIAGRIFCDCENLEKIVYEGTVEEWNSITKVDGWIKNCPLVTEVICSDGKVNVTSV